MKKDCRYYILVMNGNMIGDWNCELNEMSEWLIDSRRLRFSGDEK